jgi:hypothetical protein
MNYMILGQLPQYILWTLVIKPFFSLPLILLGEKHDADLLLSLIVNTELERMDGAGRSEISVFSDRPIHWSCRRSPFQNPGIG